MYWVGHDSAHMIEKTKTSAVGFLKTRNSWLFDVERIMSIRKETDDSENIFFKDLTKTRFPLTSKLIKRLSELQSCL